jgi:hypothetical protein
MNILLSKPFAACSLALAAFSLTALPLQANAAEPEKKPAKAVKPAKAAAKPAAKPVEDKVVDEPEPDIGDTKTFEFNCELGNKVTVYQNDTDLNSIAVRWKKRLHRLTRIETTTGAMRFENKNYGLIWIGIPAKSMLLDSKLNRQLANECQTAEQAAAEKEKASAKTS